MSLTKEQIKRELTRFQYDQYYSGERRVPLLTLARLCGLSRGNLWDIIHGLKGIGGKTSGRLGPVIEKIMAGRIRFVRIGLQWVVVETPAESYSGAVQKEGDGAHKIIPLSKPALFDRI